MEPSERPDDHVDEVLREIEERWERIAGAKRPEDLERALRKEQPRGPRWRDAIFPLVVFAFVLSMAVQTILGGDDAEPTTHPLSPDLELPVISPRSVGPVVAVPQGNVVAVVPARGGDAVPVTPLGEGARQPVWRPDGRALLVSTLGGFVELPVTRGGMPQWTLRRTFGGAYRGVSPTYSPDGRRLAWIAVLADIVVGDVGGARPQLLADYVDGGEPIELDWSRQDRLAVATHGPIFILNLRGKVVREVLGALPTAGMPSWSPNGRRVAYTQLNPRPGDGIMRVNVTEPTSRTPPGERVGPKGATTAYPAWSPDGQSIVYARFVDGTWDLYVHDLEAGRERRLTHGAGDEIDPSWSPDGRRIAFVANLLPSPR